MPYIKKKDREHIAAGQVPSNAGELNYCITLLLRRYLKVHGLQYRSINDIMGALEGAKAEFYRRVAAPYEDYKIEVNGDVYMSREVNDE